MSLIVTTDRDEWTKGKTCAGTKKTSGGRVRSSTPSRIWLQRIRGGQGSGRDFQRSGRSVIGPSEYTRTRHPSGISRAMAWMIFQAYHSTPVFSVRVARDASIPKIINYYELLTFTNVRMHLVRTFVLICSS